MPVKIHKNIFTYFEKIGLLVITQICDTFWEEGPCLLTFKMEKIFKDVNNLNELTKDPLLLKSKHFSFSIFALSFQTNFFTLQFALI